jgi:hypothetical protein
VLFSAKRVAQGFALATLLGIPIGIMIGWSRLSAGALDPMIQTLRPVPITAWLPFSIAVFGIYDTSALFLIGLGAFYPIVVNTTHGVRDTNLLLLRAARMLGAGEATVLARVGEGIVTTIGSSNTHKEVLENPDQISRTVLAKGLDAGTAFEILSIDIADVDVGSNIGARLQADQAEADKKIAQAKAEERRVMAVAREQEMKAYTQEMRAKLVEAEAQVPLALSEAFRNGKLGVMDYYNMKNLLADTDMRSAIAGAGSGRTDRNSDRPVSG